MKICMLGAGFQCRFLYDGTASSSLPGQGHARLFADRRIGRTLRQEMGHPLVHTDLEQAVNDPQVDVVIVSLPNYQHEMAVLAAALPARLFCAPSHWDAMPKEAQRMLNAVETAGVFHGYLEDLVYTPKTLKLSSR